ncbi:MAG TPA: hypothetical protein PLK94_09350, partial [Alphaproteobacteria bacterium]|nr:hypothetical protein [Alphaproteobacteria bacterium]
RQSVGVAIEPRVYPWVSISNDNSGLRALRVSKVISLDCFAYARNDDIKSCGKDPVSDTGMRVGVIVFFLRFFGTSRE